MYNNQDTCITIKVKSKNKKIMYTPVKIGFGFEGRIWVLIGPVPGHRTLVTFTKKVGFDRV